MGADFTIEYDGGTIGLLVPNTPAATEWMTEHTPQDEDHQYLGNALAIEHRYVPDIIEHVIDDGLSIENEEGKEIIGISWR